jgi:hypothetical protein
MAAVSPIIGVITQLLPLVVDLEPIVVNLVQTIEAQTGQTQDEIFTAAGAGLDENQKALLADIAARGGQTS